MDAAEFPRPRLVGAPRVTPTWKAERWRERRKGCWFYTDARYPEGGDRRYKAFATGDEADAWFAENDPEGVAWEYPDLTSFLAVERAGK